MSDHASGNTLPIGPSSPKQQLAVDVFQKVQILVLGGAMFGGKVQPYTSVVHTKHGPVKLGDVKIGDRILNPNGSDQKILAIHPHKDHQFYKVTFDDGAVTYCGMEHLWVAWRSKNSKDWGGDENSFLCPEEAEVISLQGMVEWMDTGYEVETPHVSVVKNKNEYIVAQSPISRRIISVEKAMVADGCCITVSDPNRMYLTDDYVVTHNSYLASMLSILYTDDPKSRIAVFRNTLEQMKQGGGIIDTIQSVYEPLEDEVGLEIAGNPPVGYITKGRGKGKKRGKGAKFNFLQMQHEKDMEKIRGGAFSLAIVEEATPFFTQDQIEMIMSRLRSESRHESKMIITANPHPEHFLCELIKSYYLDPEGYPIDERNGDIRYFYKVDGEYVWGNSREEVKEILEDMLSEEQKELFQDEHILSFSFVQLTAKDNPIGMKSNPGYMAYLNGLNPVMKARNLFGNWYIRPEGSGVFKREWIRGVNGERVKRIQDIPKGCTAMRGSDKAHVTPSEVNPCPDFTALSPLNLKDRNGFYWLLGNYHPETTDSNPYRKAEKTFLGRFRKLAGERDNLIAMQMDLDKQLADTYEYQEPRLVLSKDSAAGSGDYTSTVALMTERGIKTQKDLTISNVKGKKLSDFLAFTSACQNGLVYIVEETFDPDTLEAMYKEWEKFDGETASTKIIKDDWVDAQSIAFNAIKSSKRPYQTLNVAQKSCPTLSAELYKEKNHIK